jgi:hypothetical protein
LWLMAQSHLTQMRVWWWELMIRPWACSMELAKVSQEKKSLNWALRVTDNDGRTMRKGWFVSSSVGVDVLKGWIGDKLKFGRVRKKKCTPAK